MAINVDDIVKSAIMAEMSKKAEATPGPVASTPTEPLLTAATRECASNQVWASKLLGIRKDKSDFPVTMVMPESIPAEVKPFIPTRDAAYVLPKREAFALLRAWENNEKVLITGPRGSGKSSLVKELCALTGRPFLRINMTADSESAHMLGMHSLKDGQSHWNDGAITEAVRYGAVCLVDEWDVTPPEIMFALQNLLEDGGYLYLKEKSGTTEDRTLHPHANFRLVMAGNTLGQGDETGEYAGTAVQNTATLDRFGTTLHIDYMSAEHEIGIITSRVPGISKRLADSMVKVASLIRTANKNGDMMLTMSPRTLLSWANKAVAFGSISEAFTFAFINKLRSQDQRQAQEYFMKVFGSKNPE